MTRFYYDNPRQYSPAVLTDLRSAMVNNQTFAVMAVKNRFHLYVKHESLKLSLIMDQFVRAQEDNKHLLLHDVSSINLFFIIMKVFCKLLFVFLAFCA